MTYDEIKVLILLSGTTRLIYLEEEIFLDKELVRLYIDQLDDAAQASESLSFCLYIYAKWTLEYRWPIAEYIIRLDKYWWKEYKSTFRLYR